MKSLYRIAACSVITLCLILSSMGITSVYAASVQVTLPAFSITLNGIQIDNATRQYPLVLYKGITYFPMTFYDSHFLGLESYYSSSGFSIDKADVTGNYFNDTISGRNPQGGTAQAATLPIRVNGKDIDNSKEEYPVLIYQDIIYFPLTWRFATDEFGWEYSFDNSKGLVINSGSFNGEKQDTEASYGLIRVFIDNEEIHFTESDGTPFLDSNGRSQVPLRKTMESAGVNVSYDNASRLVSLSKDGININLTIGLPMVHVGDSIFRLNTVPVIIQSRTYVPLRFIFEQFGYEVEWNGAERSVNITQVTDSALKWSEPGPSHSQGYTTPLGFTAEYLFSPEVAIDDFLLSANYVGYVAFASMTSDSVVINDTVSITYEIQKINPNGEGELMCRFVFDTFTGKLPDGTWTWLKIPYSGWEVSKGQYRVTATSKTPIVYNADGEMRSNTLEEIARYKRVENVINVI